MTQEHPQAAILRAIADGKQVEYQDIDSCWYAANLYTLAKYSDLKHKFRIKPEAIVVNGVECPKPPPVGNYVVTISRENEQEHLFFTTKEDARQVFDALTLPFKGAV